jgi:hypothetical protein
VEKWGKSIKSVKKDTPKYGQRKIISPIYGLTQISAILVDKVVDKFSEFFPQGELVPVTGPNRTSRLTCSSSSHI